MKKMNLSALAAVCMALCFFAMSCNSSTDEKATPAAEETAAPVAAKPDLAKIKTDIQAIETSWAVADNARDTNAVAAFYAEDAVSMPNNKPMITGRDAIQKDIAASFIKRPKGSTVAYDVLDVFGDDNTVTEVGKITSKDAAGKVTYTGKYMAVWEKRNGKYVCVRDMSNDDEKGK
jgi:uncharacterized protein (TIGR02246 family)